MCVFINEYIIAKKLDEKLNYYLKNNFDIIGISMC